MINYLFVIFVFLIDSKMLLKFCGRTFIILKHCLIFCCTCLLCRTVCVPLTLYYYIDFGFLNQTTFGKSIYSFVSFRVVVTRATIIDLSLCARDCSLHSKYLVHLILTGRHSF